MRTLTQPAQLPLTAALRNRPPGGERRAHVDEVLVCENEAAKVRFEAKRAALLAAGKPTDEMWVFHGTPTQVCTVAC